MDVDKDGEKIIQYLAQAHMKGQFNAGCREPSYSNARADIMPVANEISALITRRESLARIEERQKVKYQSKYDWFVMDRDNRIKELKTIP